MRLSYPPNATRKGRLTKTQYHAKRGTLTLSCRSNNFCYKFRTQSREALKTLDKLNNTMLHLMTHADAREAKQAAAAAIGQGSASPSPASARKVSKKGKHKRG